MPSEDLVEIQGKQVPLDQLEKVKSYHGIRIYQPSSTPSTLPSAGGVVEIPIDSGRTLNDLLFLRVDITSATTVNRLVPSPFWLSETDGLKVMYDSTVLSTTYPLDIYTHACAMTPREVFKGVKNRWYMDKRFNEAFSLQTDTVSRQFYIPLSDITCISSIRPFVEELKGTLKVRISFNSSWTHSGTASNVTCTGLYLYAEEDILSDEEEAEERKLWREGHIQKFYSDCIAMSTIQTLTAGTKFDYQLSSFIGDFSHLFVCIRGSTKSNASGNSYTFLELGTWENAGDCRLLDSGFNAIQAIQSVNSEFNRYQAAYFFPNPRFFKEKAIYPIILTENIGDALNGVFNSFYRFTGNEYVRIQCSSSSTSETAGVFTYTPESTCTSGSYQITMFYRNHTYLTGPLSYNSTASTISSELDLWGLPCSFSVGGTLFHQGTGGMTITVSDIDLEEDYAQFTMGITSVDLTDSGGTDVMVTVSETTAGVARDEGNANGSNLNIDVFGRIHKFVEFKNGALVLSTPRVA